MPIKLPNYIYLYAFILNIIIFNFHIINIIFGFILIPYTTAIGQILHEINIFSTYPMNYSIYRKSFNLRHLNFTPLATHTLMKSENSFSPSSIFLQVSYNAQISSIVIFFSVSFDSIRLHIFCIICSLLILQLL